MQYSQINGYSISKLILGTVALGMDYGIANTQGKPALQESSGILSFALQSGINSFDTARTYGSAERLLGGFLAAHAQNKNIHVITKFKISPSHIADLQLAREEVFESVRASLESLGIQQLPVCLFHMDRSLPREAVMEIIPLVFRELIAEGLVNTAGISVDHPSEAAWFLDEPLIRVLQVPINVFDHRLSATGILQALHAKGKMIFARSVFLQGLFFVSPERLTGNLSGAVDYLNQLRLLAASENMSVAQFVFSYIRDMQEIAGIVFGAENVQQVMQNTALFMGKPLSAAAVRDISRLFAEIPEHIITPGLWTTDK